MRKGFLKIRLYEGDHELHGEPMMVLIKENSETLAALNTDENGATQVISLDTPIYGVQFLDNLTHTNAEMEPAADGVTNEIVIVIPPGRGIHQDLNINTSDYNYNPPLPQHLPLLIEEETGEVDYRQIEAIEPHGDVTHVFNPPPLEPVAYPQDIQPSDAPVPSNVPLDSPTDLMAQRVQPIRPVPPIHVPGIRAFSVSIGTVDSTRGHAWILTPSQRPDLRGHWFAPGTRVEIFASPAPGNIFTHWTLTNLSTGNVTRVARDFIAFNIRGHMAIEAHFSPRLPVRPVPPIAPLPPIRPVPPIAPRPPIRPMPPIAPRPPVRPVPPIAPRPPVRPVPPIAPQPPVRPVPPIAPLPPVRPVPPIAPAPRPPVRP